MGFFMAFTFVVVSRLLSLGPSPSSLVTRNLGMSYAIVSAILRYGLRIVMDLFAALGLGIIKSQGNS